MVVGFIDLTDNPDTFVNQNGGVFETKLASFFNGGSDLFRNEAGGTVLAAIDPALSEHSAFQGLERFENGGLVTMQDGREGDSFQISNTPGGRDLQFVGSGDSTLGVDSFLGGRGSVSDQFIVDGSVGGKTALAVNDTNPGPGAPHAVIPVVFVNGAAAADAFFLPQPIEKGFFAYDLFFRPTGSGVFELRSFPGAKNPAAVTHREPGHLVCNIGHLVRPHRRFARAAQWR